MTASIQAIVRGIMVDDEIHFGDDRSVSMECIFSRKNLQVNGILIQLHPMYTDYPEDSREVEVMGCILRYHDGRSLNLGKPERVWFDQWYDELCANSYIFGKRSEDEFGEVDPKTSICEMVLPFHG